MAKVRDTADAALRERLTEEQYQITQKQGTEPPFSGKYVENKADGSYACICCGMELFSSENKYDSGTGWPSFWLPLAADRVEVRLDSGRGMQREEVVCASCGAHLGHVFPDGPEPSGLRYCINSGSLDFEDGETPEGGSEQ
jgi:peptide-methionine (R)-S-oxide reductase